MLQIRMLCKAGYAFTAAGFTLTLLSAPFVQPPPVPTVAQYAELTVAQQRKKRDDILAMQVKMQDAVKKQNMPQAEAARAFEKINDRTNRQCVVRYSLCSPFSGPSSG